MNNSYDDIRQRIKEEPKWWDEEAVPRYCDFAPRETANIYADDCCLVLIECQGCRRPFHVCFSETRQGRFSRARDRLHYAGVHEPSNEEYEQMMEEVTLKAAIKQHLLHYGDPPNVDCCAAGSVMNSIPVQVLEFWHSNKGDWERVPELEVDIWPDWMEPDEEE